MWCMVVVAFADLDVAFPSRMKLFVLISNSKIPYLQSESRRLSREMAAISGQGQYNSIEPL